MSEEVKKLTEEELKAQAARKLNQVARLETEAKELEMVLSENPQFVKFLQVQKAFADKSAEVKKNLEAQMIASKIKSITIDAWGKITIVEREDIKVVDEDKLPKKFFKKQVDQKLLNDTVKMTNVLPEGTKRHVTKYIKMTPKKEK